jgi:hypothetical protein
MPAGVASDKYPQKTIDKDDIGCLLKYVALMKKQAKEIGTRYNLEFAPRCPSSPSRILEGARDWVSPLIPPDKSVSG